MQKKCENNWVDMIQQHQQHVKTHISMTAGLGRGKLSCFVKQGRVRLHDNNTKRYDDSIPLVEVLARDNLEQDIHRAVAELYWLLPPSIDAVDYLVTGTQLEQPVKGTYDNIDKVVREEGWFPDYSAE